MSVLTLFLKHKDFYSPSPAGGFAQKVGFATNVLKV
jgi:hypothetical protein